MNSPTPSGPPDEPLHTQVDDATRPEHPARSRRGVLTHAGAAFAGITIGVLIGVTAGSGSDTGQSINYLCGPVPLLDTVQLDQFHGPMLIDAEAHLEKYRRLLDVVEGMALSPAKSRDLIQSIAQNL
ncbi:Scr1 family TA system antitoxin-like transcriptional regulator [Streptomyces sp. NRRL B-3229]|uniref:Scr1 family TA system antitoxin-like transcriptional regulator n=1 Tax=Streptomyces sp. NRRL B-3229 TaxID=1463836 RepID=UPI000B0A95B6|nr:Scr1 family TA system antitoxin-like transcriptional regulator [Streptomyces sp. NRRL B-3229]